MSRILNARCARFLNASDYPRRRVKSHVFTEYVDNARRSRIPLFIVLFKPTRDVGEGRLVSVKLDKAVNRRGDSKGMNFIRRFVENRNSKPIAFSSSNLSSLAFESLSI